MSNQIEINVTAKKKSKLNFLKRIILSRSLRVGLIAGSLCVFYFHINWHIWNYVKNSEDSIQKELNQVKIFIEENRKYKRAV
jgi:hypothetical protein